MEFLPPYFPVWFALPVRDITRSLTFYEKVFGWKASPILYPPGETRESWLFHLENGEELHGEIYLDPDRAGVSVATFFLHVENIEKLLSAVRDAGGKIDSSIILLPDGKGRCASFFDPDGNSIGLWSPSPLVED